MDRERVVGLAAELWELYRDPARHPFPYEGCRKVIDDRWDKYGEFIPDLDFYMSYIAGYAYSAPGLADRSPDEIRTAYRRLQQSFFEKHPRYRPLGLLITHDDTPDLFASIRVHEQMRLKLLEILPLLVDMGD